MTALFGRVRWGLSRAPIARYAYGPPAYRLVHPPVRLHEPRAPRSAWCWDAADHRTLIRPAPPTTRRPEVTA